MSVLCFTRDPNLASYPIFSKFCHSEFSFHFINGSHLGISTIFGFSENYLMKFPNIPLLPLSKTPYFLDCKEKRPWWSGWSPSRHNNILHRLSLRASQLPEHARKTHVMLFVMVSHFAFNVALLLDAARRSTK